MLTDFISNYTQNSYLIALFFLAVWFLIIKIGLFIIEKVIIKLTLKTKTDLDDLIVEKSSKPLTIIAFLIGFRVAFSKLPFTEGTLTIINGVLNSLIIVVVAYLIYSIFGIAFSRTWRKAAKKAKTEPNEGLIGLAEGTLKVIILLVAFIYVVSSWGVEIGPLLAGIGIGGIAIAFALQESLSNIFGGISVILDKTINVGDWIKLEDGTVGIILKIGLRSTKLKTFDNEILFIPNSMIANKIVQNLALPDPKARAVIPFSVAYGSDINKVKKVILNELKKIDHFINDPEPSVKFLEMADSSLNFKAYFYVDSFKNRFAAIDEANTRIYNILRKNKIEIPFPQMDIHMRK